MFGWAVVAMAAKPPVDAGVYLVNGQPLAVGKKGRSLQWDGGEVTATKAGSHAFVDASGWRTPAITLNGAAWFPSVIVVGDEVVTTAWGRFTWGPDGCVSADPDATPPTCEEVDGVRTVDGEPLFERAPGVFTSSTVPGLRADSVEEARKLARDVFVDAAAKATVASASGEWWVHGDWVRHQAFQGASWVEDDSVTRAIAPLSACMVEGTEAGGLPAAYPLWSDGQHAGMYEVAVRVGDVVYGCEGDSMVRYQRGACESFSWTAPAEEGQVGYWSTFPGLCGGTQDAPATFRTAFPETDVPGLWTTWPLRRDAPPNALPPTEPPAE